MPTATRPRRAARTRRPDVFEDYRAGNGDEALLRYYEQAPRPVAESEPEPPRHVVALYWPWDLEKKPLMWKFGTVEEARVGWVEARAYLVSLGFARLTD